MLTAIDTFACLCPRVVINQQLRDARLHSSLQTSLFGMPASSWLLLTSNLTRKEQESDKVQLCVFSKKTIKGTKTT